MSVPAGRRAGWLQYGLPALVASLTLAAAGWATWLNVRLPRASAGQVAMDSAPNEPSVADPVTLPPFEGEGDEPLSRKALLDTEIPLRPRVDVIFYTVQEGDSVFAIARKFGVKPETVLWGSYDVLKDDPHMLRPGQDLGILPIDGTYHEWRSGDTLEGIADFYGVDPEEIIDWPGNDLSPGDMEIAEGTWLVIPGGHRALRQWLAPTIARGAAGVGMALGPGGCSGDYSGGTIGTGGFIWPTTQHYVSGNDYWSGHLAIDIGAVSGAAVWAADGGVIVFAGWATNGYGNAVMIDHGNGWQTLYAHLSSVAVGCGQSVSQGETIGGAGSTGNSTGTHLHFETRLGGGFVNPWYVLP